MSVEMGWKNDTYPHKYAGKQDCLTCPFTSLPPYLPVPDGQAMPAHLLSVYKATKQGGARPSKHSGESTYQFAGC